MAQQQIIEQAARRYGIEPRVLWGVYGTESDYGRNPSTSSAGAEGPFQFLPSTARGMGVDPHNFRSAAFGAAKYLSQYKRRGLAGMLSAYNAGPAGALQPSYVKTVLEKARSWQGGAGSGRSSVDSQAPGSSPAPGQLGVQQGEPGVSPDLIAALQQALAPAPPAPVAASASIARPAHSAGPLLPAGARTPPPLTPAPEPDPAQKILPLLEQLTAGGTSSKVTGGEAPPTSSGPQHALTRAVPHGTKLVGFLPGGATLEVGRIDQGQDLRTDPGGPILAPGAGYVVAVKDNPGGFGTRYPIVHFTTGPLAGHDVYIGHTHSTLPAGAHFGAGATLSRTGHGTPAEGNARTPGWAEIGLWGAGGPGNMQAGRQIRPLLGLR